ncbi:MAG: ribonuclease HII [Thermoplasmataceae archaeon]|jgi:ribonuclease HII
MEIPGRSEHCECGLDEAGRGPVIGPMVVAMLCATNNAMKEIGARDSKTLSPASRERIFQRIRESASQYSFKIIGVQEINRKMETMTLNQIEEEAYVALIAQSGCAGAYYVDSFDVNEERLTARLSSLTGKNVICRHKADALFPVVSAASIVAKVVRDSEIEKLKLTYGDFGSGYPSDPRTVAFLERSISSNDDLTDIVRVHWETYRRLISRHWTGRLF